MMLRSAIAIWLVSCSAAISITVGQTLRYSVEPEQEFMYGYRIEVETTEEKVTYDGTTKYVIDACRDDHITLIYSGGLTERRVAKNRNRGIGPYFPPMFPPNYTRSQFAGKQQTTNRIIMTSLGKVLSMKGDSQMPFLLGNVSLMPFEPLPGTDRDSWATDSGVSITSKTETRNRFGGPMFFDPFGHEPRGGGSVQAANEMARYSVVADEKDVVEIKKLYQLTMPANGDGESFDMTGAGVWKFSRAKRIPQSIDMTFKLISRSGKTSTTIPIHLKYDLLTQEDIDRLAEAAKKAAAKNAEYIAKRKVDEAKPLTEQEITDAITSLKSGDIGDSSRTLHFLNGKTPTEPNEQIVAIVKHLFESGPSSLKSMSKRVLEKWLPDFKRINDLVEDYSGSGRVDTTGRKVHAHTHLDVGQILAVQQHRNYWKAAEIVGLNPDGSVTVRERGGFKKLMTVPRSELQLAPNDLPQPNLDKPSATPIEQPRKWSDQSGAFSVTAKLLRIEDAKAILELEDGQLVQVPTNKLSDADREYLAEQNQKKPEGIENPFTPQ